MTPDPAPRLTIELVPQTCWFSNVRDQVSNPDWDRIRKRVYARAGRRCEVCGGRGRQHFVECHEVWEYDDTALVQRLVRMIALCPACHQVKHMGLAGLRGRGEQASAHLAKVNHWTPLVTARYIDQAFVVWRERSDRTWSLDLSALAAYGIDAAIIARANGTSVEDRSLTVAAVTTKVRSRQKLPPRETLSELDLYITRLMCET
jgi:hypothetical protein